MMNDTEALDILRSQGYAVSQPDLHTGRVRVWFRRGEDAVDVAIGRELQELAEGILCFEDIQARRDDETGVRGE